MKKLSLITSALVGLVMVAFIAIAVTLKSGTTNKFSDDGFIIGNEIENSTGLNYFSTDTTYSKLSNEVVEFKNTEGERTIVNNASFIHYNDGSIQAMSDGVITMLTPEMASGITNTYYVHPRTMLVNNGGKYVVSNGNSNLEFDNFLYKLNHNKYMIVSKNMKLNLPNNNVIDIKDFLEVSYVDNGVVYLSDGTNSWTTVSLDSNLTLNNGLVFNFMTREVLLDNQVVLQLNRLLVDSYDNIEILPFQDGNFTIPKINIEGKDGEQGKDGDDGEDGANGARGTSGSGGASGADGDTGDEGGTKYELPDFKVSNFDISNTSVSFDLEIPTNDSMLIDPATNIPIKSVKVSLFDVNTNKRINFDDDFDISGGNSNTISFTGLDPDTPYRIVVNSNYFLNNQKLNRDFITKNFRTTAFDVDFSVYYTTPDQVNVKVDKPKTGVSNEEFTIYVYQSPSKAQQVLSSYYRDGNISVLDEKAIKEEIGSFQESSSSVVISIDNLTSDTQYGLLLKYGNSVINKVVKGETLKKAPKLRELTDDAGNIIPNLPTVIDNMKIYGFDLVMPYIENPDNSITEIRWNIYKADGTYSLENKPIKTITSKYTLDPVKLYIDNKVINKGETYIAELILVYDDNVSKVDWKVGKTVPFVMDSKRLPVVSFVPATLDETGNNKYSNAGSLIISDPELTIVTTQDLIIQITSLDRYYYGYRVEAKDYERDSSGNIIIHNPFTDGTEFGKQYLVNVYGTVNMTGASSKSNTYIGGCAVNMAEIDTIQLNFYTDVNGFSTGAKAYVAFQTQRDNTDEESYKAIVDNYLTKVEFILKMYNSLEEVTPSSTYRSNAYYLENPDGTKSWYSDVAKQNKLQTVGEKVILEIGEGTDYFFNIKNNELIGKIVTVECKDSVAYDYTIFDNWYGEESGNRKLLSSNEDYYIKQYSSNPYKNYQNTIPLDTEPVKIVIELSVPELINNGLALEVTEIKNEDSEQYSLTKNPNLDNDTVIGYKVKSNHKDPNAIFKSKSFYMLESKDFNSFNNNTKLSAPEKDLIKNSNLLKIRPENIDDDKINDPIIQAVIDQNKLLSQITYSIEDQKKENLGGVIFLLGDTANSITNDVKDKFGVSYRVIETGQPRGKSYTFAFTAEVDQTKVMSEQYAFVTYPYCSPNYIDYTSTQYANPVFAPKQAARVNFMPYEYTKDAEKLLVKYGISDIDKTIVLADDNKKLADLINDKGQKINYDGTVSDADFNLAYDLLNVSKNQVTISSDGLVNNVSILNNLIVPTSSDVSYNLETYYYDVTLYGNGDNVDIGNRFGTDEKYVTNERNKYNQSVFKLKALNKLSKDLNGDQTFDNYVEAIDIDTSNISLNREIIVKVKLKEKDYFNDLALVDVIFKNGSKEEIVHNWLTGLLTNVDSNNVLNLRVPLTDFIKFNSEDVVTVNLNFYFLSDLLGYSYLNGSNQSSDNAIVKESFGVAMLDGSGKVNKYVAPQVVNKNVLANFDSSQPLSASKSIFSYDGNIETNLTYNDEYIVPIKALSNQLSEDKIDMDLYYQSGKQAKLPSKIYCISYEEENLTFNYPPLPLVAEAKNFKGSSTQYVINFKFSQYKEGDEIYFVYSPTANKDDKTTVKLNESEIDQLVNGSFLYQLSIKDLTPSTSYTITVYFKREGTNQAALKGGSTNEYAEWQFVTTAKTSIESISLDYDALSYTDKNLRVSANLVDYPIVGSLNYIQFYIGSPLLKIDTNTGEISDGLILAYSETIPVQNDTVTCDFNIYELNKDNKLPYNNELSYKVYAAVYGSSYGYDGMNLDEQALYISMSDVIPFNLEFKKPFAYTILSSKYDENISEKSKKHSIVTNSVSFSDPSRSIVNDTFIASLFELADDGSETFIESLTFNSNKNNTIKNNGFTFNSNLKALTQYKVRIMYLIDKNNNGRLGKDFDSEPLPDLDSYKDKNPNSFDQKFRDYIGYTDFMISTLKASKHNLGLVSGIYSNGKIYLRMINTNNVKYEIRSIEYKAVYNTNDGPKSMSGAFLLAEGDEPFTKKYLNLLGENEDSFDILLEGLEVINLDSRYEINITINFIKDINNEESMNIKLVVIPAVGGSNS